MIPFKSLRRLFILLFFVTGKLAAQSPITLTDGRETASCGECLKLLRQKPKEVLFGINVNRDGDIYFSMSNKDWFYKIFTGPRDGITTDLVAKDLYNCTVPLPDNRRLLKGKLIPPVYLADLKKNIKDIGGGHFVIKIGHVPDYLAQKELEGNLIIIKNGVICYYTYFVNIDRSSWDLLPMGLYTDTLLNYEPGNDTSRANAIFYTKKLQFTIPFLKNKSSYNTADIKPLYDSLQLTGYSIKSITIRAYSSVEGPEPVNNMLQRQRAQSIVKALQHFQSPEIKTNISTGENWIEFYNDIGKSPFNELARLGKPEVKEKLLDKVLLEQAEPYLTHHRKAVVTIYLNRKTGFEKTRSDSLIVQFKDAIARRNIAKASIIQDAIFERVADGKLPDEYIYKLEIPNESDFSSLKNNQVTYKFRLHLTYEQEALEELQEIEKLSPENGKVKYNICVLTFNLWRYDSSYAQPATFLNSINVLAGLGISPSLIKRMLVNYYIVMSQLYMQRYDYDAKDRALEYIRNNYTAIQLTDEDLLALAKYLCYYSQNKWAEALITNRVNKIEVDENLLFFYINLKLFDPYSFTLPEVKKAALNAININRKRFCQFFNSPEKGGASFQLLENESLRTLYCESCK